MDTPQPGGKVVPLFGPDLSPAINGIWVRCGLAFDDVLDPEILRQGLERLLRRDGWNKLGGRLKRNRDGGIDCHILAKHTAESSAIEFSHVEHDMKMADHPVASRLPRLAPQAHLQPLILDGFKDIVDLFSHNAKDRKLNYWLDKDRPIISLYITSFRDGTLVSLMWSHAVLDLMGLNSVVDAWLLVLQGREAEVATPYAGSDPCIPFTQAANEPHVLADRLLWPLGNVFLALRMLFNSFWSDAEHRILCVPASFLKRLREAALKDIEADENAYKPPFLSDGDLVVSWITHTEVSVSPPNVKNLVAVISAHSERDALAEAGLVPEGTPYLSNAISSLILLLEETQILENSVGHLASWIRRTIVEQVTIGQARAFMYAWLGNRFKAYPFFGHWRMHMAAFTNWAKAKWYEKDFSTAVRQQQVHDEDKVSPVPVGRPFYVQCNNLPPFMTESMAVIVGKDLGGNYWVNARMSKRKWDRIEKMLAEAGDE